MKKTSLLILVALFISGCATSNVKPQQTQLQLREFQTRSYDTTDTKMVMKAVLNVLQDDAFIVKNAVVELGLLTAEKQMDVENRSQAFFATFFWGRDARWKKASIIDCTVNVSLHGEETRVRVNFQMKVLNNVGNVVTIKPIQDEKFYQAFFAKVDKGIFIQKEEI